MSSPACTKRFGEGREFGMQNISAKALSRERRSAFPTSLDEILFQFTLNEPSVSPKKVLFWGEGAGEISSYVAGWMAGQGIDVIVLDGANRFNPYMVSSFARKALIPPERLLKRIRVARAFTCYQMATLMGRLISLVGTIHESPVQKPWVILLGPITTFLDEDVPEREIRPLFERSLKKVEEMAMGGIPFFLFQPSVFSDDPPSLPFFRRGERAYLTERLSQFSNEVWKICVEDKKPKVILEKGLAVNNKTFSPSSLETTS